MFFRKQRRIEALEAANHTLEFHAICDDILINHWRSKAKGLEKEIKRLKEGNFTPEEFQNLCHNLHEKCLSDGLTRQAFEDGCKAYQDKLFGSKEPQQVKEDKPCSEQQVYPL